MKPRLSDGRSLAERSRLRAKLWSFNRRRPNLYWAIVAARTNRGGREVVRRDTSIVIDGFERSGNTYAYFAFKQANPHVYRIGHHTHSLAQFHWATKWAVPTILLLRDPRDVVTSVHLRWPKRRLEEILADYIYFHTTILDLTEDIIIAPFPLVITRYASIINAVNKRWGTAFTLPDPADDELVFRAIDARTAARYGYVDEIAVARPSQRRREASEKLAVALQRPNVAAALREACEIHCQVLSARRELT